MIIPIIIVVLCIVFLFVLMGSGKKQPSNKEEGTLVSAQDFINVRDIVGHVLYTRDNYCMSYIRLQPPMSSLWSRRDKRMRTNTLTAEASKDRKPWKLTAVSRPMDITQLVNQYQQLRDETENPIRKKILKQEMMNLQSKVGGGEAVERQFYIQIWAPYKEHVEEELLERARQVASIYESIGIVCQVLKKPDIIRFCNLVHNPAYINIEDTIAEPALTMVAVEDIDKEEVTV